MWLCLARLHMLHLSHRGQQVHKEMLDLYTQFSSAAIFLLFYSCDAPETKEIKRTLSKEQ